MLLPRQIRKVLHAAADEEKRRARAGLHQRIQHMRRNPLVRAVVIRQRTEAVQARVVRLPLRFFGHVRANLRIVQRRLHQLRMIFIDRRQRNDQRHAIEHEIRLSEIFAERLDRRRIGRFVRIIGICCVPHGLRNQRPRGRIRRENVGKRDSLPGQHIVSARGEPHLLNLPMVLLPRLHHEAHPVHSRPAVEDTHGERAVLRALPARLLEQGRQFRRVVIRQRVQLGIHRAQRGCDVPHADGRAVLRGGFPLGHRHPMAGLNRRAVRFGGCDLHHTHRKKQANPSQKQSLFSFFHGRMPSFRAVLYYFQIRMRQDAPRIFHSG